MEEPRPDPLLAYARELDDADRSLASATQRLDELRAEVQSLGERAREVERILARLPEAREAAAASVGAAEAELARRQEELAEAEAALADAGDRGGDEALAAARRAVVRTRDTAASAGRKLERARSAQVGVEREAEVAGREAPELERRARELGAELRELPRVARHAAAEPAPGLAGAIAWASRAAAALFVARSGLATERERVVREANELASAAFGEPLPATSVALVRERLERRS